MKNGRQIQVNDSNKEVYIALRYEFELREGFQKALDKLKSGFYYIIPFENIKDFEPAELEILICGLDVIDLNDWKSNTIYKSLFTNTHQVIL